MEISQQCVVALTWTLKDTLGEELDVLDDPDFNDQLLFLEPRALFPKDIEAGMTFEGASLPAGCNPDAPKDALYTVSEIYPDHIVLDGNHPLAGIALRLSLKVEDVREATVEEIGAGSAGTGFFRIQPVHAGQSGNPTLH